MSENVDIKYIFVAGYLVVYDHQESAGREYELTREQSKSALPVLPGTIPINIDHESSCVVGTVLTILDLPRGLFCLGVVSTALAPIFLSYVQDDALFANAEEGMVLTETEKFLYLLSNILPSLSLSSRRLEKNEVPGKDFFAHVALCELGRREGTVAIYGATASEAIGAFDDLSAPIKEQLYEIATREKCAEVPRELSRPEITRVLMKKFMHGAFLMDRGTCLKTRREMAAVYNPKYLQANEVITIGIKEHSEETPENAIKDRSVSTQTAPSFDISESQQLSGQTHVPAMESATCSGQFLQTKNGASPSASREDMVYVPFEKYASLLAASARRDNDRRPVSPSREFSRRSRDSTHECSPGRDIWPRGFERHPRLESFMGPGMNHTYRPALYEDPNFCGRFPYIPYQSPASTYPVHPNYYSSNFGQFPGAGTYPIQYPSLHEQTVVSRLDALISALEKNNKRDSEYSENNPRKRSARTISENDPYFPGEMVPAKKITTEQQLCEKKEPVGSGINDILQGILTLQKEVAGLKSASNADSSSERKEELENSNQESARETVDASMPKRLKDAQTKLKRKKEAAAFAQMMAD
nr:capsid maturation protease [Gallid alphaherpesvirus 1]